MINVADNVSNLTNIPVKYLNKIKEAESYVINDTLAEALQSGENTIQLNFNIGTLNIKIEDNEIFYKFIPSAQLENSVRNTIINKQNLLEAKLEKTLVDRISKVYKDLI